MRVFDWIDRTNVAAEIHPYAGLSTNSPANAIRHPVKVVRGETDVRGLLARPLPRLLLHREASPLSDGTLESELLRRSELGVYDIDDALFVDHDLSWTQRLGRPRSRRAEAAARSATRIIAANEYLAEWAADHCSDVVLIPSCVSLDDHPRKTSYELGDPPRICWIGSATTEHHLEIVHAPFEELHRRTGARLALIGGGGSFRAPFVDRFAWSLDTYATELARCDIGIMPLKEGPFHEGKSAYKLLQYGAAGLVAVGSPVGANRGVLDGMDMPAPASSAAWFDALDHLIAMSSNDRQRMAQRARRFVAGNYTYDVWAEVWLDAVGCGGG